MARSRLGTVGWMAVGAGAATAAAWAAAEVSARRIRSRTDPANDALRPPPSDVVHRSIDTADGASLHVVERGQGRPLLLMHGVTLQWWVWGAQFNTLADRYRVLAWDMRGHGRSTVGSEGITLEAIADDIAAVLEDLDLRDAILVGHSMGGMALGRFCARHEDLMIERCGGLMFLDTSAAPMALPGRLDGNVRAEELVRRAAYAGTSRPRVRYTWPDSTPSVLMARSAFGRRPSATAVLDVREMLSVMDQDNLLAAGRAIVDHDVRSDLAHVKVPAMVVVGSADRLTPVAQARVLADSIPGSVLRVLPGVGHQTMQEDPVRFAELVDELSTLSP
ncbi:MAG TPA: alpha/beta hydrolase [Microthrixaceae bacterium]|nr:alpha/beta hydrolase [Microthrixaceae bacterium]